MTPPQNPTEVRRILGRVPDRAGGVATSCTPLRMSF